MCKWLSGASIEVAFHINCAYCIWSWPEWLATSTTAGSMEDGR